MKTTYNYRFLLYALIAFSAFFPDASVYGQLAKCKGKYLGNIIQNSVRSDYNTYWNQATSENGSKWGSVEGTQGRYNFSTSDVAYNWAKNNNGLFKYHTLVWGSQTPGWVSSASTATLTAAIHNYIKAVADHYNPMGGLEMIDVLNEPVNTAMPGNMKAALTAGYQAEPANANDRNNQYGWVIWPFQLARKYFPDAVLMINEYNVEMNWNNCRAPYIAMVNAVKNAPNLTDGKKNLIDGVGLQCHGIDNLTAANFKACIDEIWTKTGIAIHISEFDQVANPNEAKQQSVYSTLIPVAWEHPHVAGITLWGYVQGTTWINGNGASGPNGTDSGLLYNSNYSPNPNGERPAMTSLKQYMTTRPSLSCCPAPAPFGSCTNTNNPPAVSISSPVNNTSFTAPASITIQVSASDADGTISNVQFYNGTTLLGSDATSPYSFTWTNVTTGTYVLTAVATDNSGAKTTSSPITITVSNPVVQSPYGGTPASIPGVIEAEKYDLGGQGVAFNETTSGNSGSAFRTDDVDVEATADAGGGYNVGWIASGEWLEYTVNVTADGIYTIEARVASENTGTSFHIEMDGENIAGPINVPNTGAWQTFQSVTIENISLTAGQKVMRIAMDADYFNINHVAFTTANTSTNTPPVVNITSPVNNANFTAPASITINANASDEDGTISHVQFYNGTTLLGSDAVAPYSFTWTNVAAGTYSITAKATDDSGAVATSPAISVIVKGPNQPPSVSISSPANNASFSAPASITINATAADTDGTISSVQFYNGTTLLGSDANAPYSFTWNNVAAGTYTLTVKATDNSGTESTSAPVSITVTATETATIIGTDCGSTNTTISFELNPNKRTGATNYSWWFQGSTQSINPVAGATYKVNIQTGTYFTGGEVCVGVNYSAAPYYASFCKTVNLCSSSAQMMANSSLESESSIAPNPSVEIFTLTASSDILTLKIVDSQGEILETSNNIDKGNSITFGQNLPEGLFTIVIQYSNGKTETRKIMKGM